MAKRREQLPDRLRRLLSERDMTQEELAELADVPFPTLRDLLYKDVDPKLSTVIKIAAAFDMGLDEFVFGKARR